MFVFILTILNELSNRTNLIQYRRMIKQDLNRQSSARSVSNRQFSSKIIQKCQRQRNFYIRREVGNLIKKQVKIFFATEKLEKQFEEKSKDVMYTPAESPVDKIHKYQIEQKHKYWEGPKKYKIQNAQRMRKLAEREKQKQIAHKKKASQNLFRMTKAQQKHEQILEKDNKRIEQLKKHLTIQTPRPTARINSSKICSNEKVLQRVSTAKETIRQNEESKMGSYIGSYLEKMRILQQRQIKNQLKRSKQNQAHHKQVKNCMSKRKMKQEEMMNTWKSKYEKKLQNFESNHRMIQEKRYRTLMERSIFNNSLKDQVFERKRDQEERMAQMRISLMKDKLNKITLAPKRNEELENKSQTSFVKNIKNWKEDHEKEQHNDIMRQLYNIIQKLKQLDSFEKLKKSEIDFLLKNLDPCDNTSDSKQLLAYLNSTKEKFFEQKRKQEEERAKKNKKNNQKLL